MRVDAKNIVRGASNCFGTETAISTHATANLRNNVEFQQRKLTAVICLIYLLAEIECALCATSSDIQALIFEYRRASGLTMVATRRPCGARRCGLPSPAPSAPPREFS
ncbi:MAG: hypothetical protein JSR86_13535 [Proteobacteria bacterium]|nr:hypothetical protein [Pseudomonadota bacterium]